MGDRAMAEIKTQDGSIYVYTHWGGSDLPDTAKYAVSKAKPRWDDESYATHIIIDQLTREGRDSETGFGIMLKPDSEDSYNDDEPSVIIDLPNRTITVMREGKTEVTKFSDINI